MAGAKRVAVAAWSWAAETLDRQTGGAARTQARVDLWPRHLMAAIDTHTPRGDGGGGSSDGGVGGAAAPLQLEFQASVKCHDTPVIFVTSFSSELRYRLLGALDSTVLFNTVRGAGSG